MSWYNPRDWFTKANPAQQFIAQNEGPVIYTDSNISISEALDKVEVLRRGVNMVVFGCSSLDFDVKDKVMDAQANGVRQKTLATLLNYRPNPYQSIQEFRSSIFTDFLLEGNIFIYFDGVYLYHLPAKNVEVHSDPKAFVSKYTYSGAINNPTEFKPDEIIHIKDISSHTIYRGTSRLISASRSIKTLYSMQSFQDQFFVNGAVTGLVLETDSTLSTAAKEKTIQHWQSRYSPKNGARKPLILDSGLKVSEIATPTFKDLDFDISIDRHDTKILKALGVPPILLDGGNNANISPNLRLFYLETVLPIVTKFASAMERYFGYDLLPVTANVSALQPDLKDVAAYLTTLVNGGVISPNEARVELRREVKPGHDDLRIPANIAGSAANPSVGGAPKAPAD